MVLFVRLNIHKPSKNVVLLDIQPDLKNGESAKVLVFVCRSWSVVGLLVPIRGKFFGSRPHCQSPRARARLDPLQVGLLGPVYPVSLLFEISLIV